MLVLSRKGCNIAVRKYLVTGGAVCVCQCMCCWMVTIEGAGGCLVALEGLINN